MCLPADVAMAVLSTESTKIESSPTTASGTDDDHWSIDGSSAVARPAWSRWSSVAVFGSTTMCSVRSGWSVRGIHVDLVHVPRVTSANLKIGRNKNNKKLIQKLQHQHQMDKKYRIQSSKTAKRKKIAIISHKCIHRSNVHIPASAIQMCSACSRHHTNQIAHCPFSYYKSNSNFQPQPQPHGIWCFYSVFTSSHLPSTYAHTYCTLRADIRFFCLPIHVVAFHDSIYRAKEFQQRNCPNHNNSNN